MKKRFEELAKKEKGDPEAQKAVANMAKEFRLKEGASALDVSAAAWHEGLQS